MADKKKQQPDKPAVEDRESGPGEWVPLQEGRYGASWFVMLAGLVLVAYFYLSLLVENLIVIKKVTSPDIYGGPSDWALNMAPWVNNSAYLLVFGTLLFLVGYSLTLKRKGGVPRGRLLMRLFGVCTGFAALAILVLGCWYTFFLPKELAGLTDKLDFYGLQFTSFLLWGGIMAAVTVYCWLPRND